MRKNKALIIGLAGQDGTLLAELLAEKNYFIVGISRRCIDELSGGIKKALDRLILNHNLSFIPHDAIEAQRIEQLIVEHRPDEIYYLASCHEVAFDQSGFEDAKAVNFEGLQAVLDITKRHSPETKIFYASSSNVFAASQETPQSENTLKAPISFYGHFKNSAMDLIALHRRQWGAKACSGILFNHESHLRDEFFLPQKIVSSAVRLRHGSSEKLHLGNTNAKRDWGYAGDFVEAMWLMLQQESFKDYVVGTGKLHSVGWILEFVFSYLDLDWQEHVVLDPSLMRDNEPIQLLANCSAIREDLGWQPKLCFEELLEKMILEKIALD